ncbi:MAG: histidine kinase [Leucobacter sp.]
MNKAPWVGLLIAVGFTALTIPAWVSLLSVPEPGPHRELAIAIAVGYVLTAIAASLLTSTGAPPALRIAAVVVVMVLGASVVGLLGVGSFAVLAWAICLVLVLVPRTAGIIVTAVTLLALAVSGFMSGNSGEAIPGLILLLSVAVATVLVIHLAEVHEQLAEAKDAVADLAVLRERERLSRDLHDVFGGSATTIALKARLGVELVARDDLDGARSELADIGQLASTISRDVGGAVRDLRQTTLEAELAAADTATRAADIRLDVRRIGTPNTENEPILAMIVRESVTNVVRHAAASLVVVTVEADGVVIADDGRGTPQNEGAGIQGMRERATERGGTFIIDGAPNTGTVVTARLP